MVLVREDEQCLASLNGSAGSVRDALPAPDRSLAASRARRAMVNRFDSCCMVAGLQLCVGPVLVWDELLINDLFSQVGSIVRYSWDVVSSLPVVAIGAAVPVALALQDRAGQRANDDVERLRVRETMYAAILEFAPDGMAIVNSTSRIELANAQFQAMFGYTQDEVIGRTLESLFSHAASIRYVEMRDQHLAAADQAAPATDIELIAQRKDGEQFPVDLSLRSVQTPQGRLLTVALRDASARKRAEQQLLNSERLAGIGQTISGLAHEGRNALQQILAGVEMLQLKLPPEHPALSLVSGLAQAQDRLHRLFEEVRGFVAPLHLKFAREDLLKVCRDAWAGLSGVIAGRDVRYVDDGLPQENCCECDALQMQQVFRNILENSLAACSDPVELHVCCTSVMLHDEPAVQISIQDNGPGLNAAQRAKIFDAFFTTKTQGTGLGMAISKRIVEAHGGQIEVGDPPAGAQIVITLPCTRRETESRSA